MTLPEYFLSCICGSPEHQLIFRYDDEELWTEVHLANSYNFIGRIWVAMKYILGYRSKYGHWDCVLLDREKAEKLRDFIEEFLRQANDN